MGTYGDADGIVIGIDPADGKGKILALTDGEVQASLSEDGLTWASGRGQADETGIHQVFDDTNSVIDWVASIGGTRYGVMRMYSTPGPSHVLEITNSLTSQSFARYIDLTVENNAVSKHFIFNTGTSTLPGDISITGSLRMNSQRITALANASADTDALNRQTGDARYAPIAAADHGGLTGLADDDHSQYLLATGARAGSSSQAQSFGATGIKTDAIAESTGAAGVTVDGVLLKDSAVTASGGVITGAIKPAANSTTALQLQKSDGTSVLNVDTTNGRVGINITNPANALDLNTGSLKTTQATITEVYLENTGLRMKNIFTGGSWARGLITYQNSSGVDYCQIGAKGNGQDFGYLFLGVAYDNTWLRANSNEVTINDDSSDIDFRVESDNSANAFFVEGSSGNVGIGTSAPASLLHVLANSALTNTVQQLSTLGHNTSGTPAAGYGASIVCNLESSTTTNQAAARIAWLWETATHASRKADLVGYVNDSGGEREGWRIRANGSAPAIGFLGATPAARQSHIADPSGGSTVDAEARSAINSILSALETFGLLATS